MAVVLPRASFQLQHLSVQDSKFASQWERVLDGFGVCQGNNFVQSQRKEVPYHRALRVCPTAFLVHCRQSVHSAIAQLMGTPVFAFLSRWWTFVDRRHA